VNDSKTAIKQIRDWQSVGTEDIVWIVVNSGYTEADRDLITQASGQYNVQLLWLNNKDDVFKFFDTGRDRSQERITDITSENGSEF
jgi:hypothetical protein